MPDRVGFLSSILFMNSPLTETAELCGTGHHFELPPETLNFPLGGWAEGASKLNQVISGRVGGAVQDRAE